MKIPALARYDFATKTAYKFLIEENIRELPIDPQAICKKNGWTVITYDDLAKEKNVSIDEICQVFGKDGYTTYSLQYYCIAYNSHQPRDRTLFTFLHEIGHIVLNHFISFDETIITRGGLTKREYSVLENEANVFARNVLSPAPLVEKLNPYCLNYYNILFGTSYQAWQTRRDLLYSDLSYMKPNLKFQIIQLFVNFMYGRECNICGFTYVKKPKQKFCEVCGNSSVMWKGKGVCEIMIYDSNITLDEKGKAIMCPICDNEDISDEGPHCKICGVFLINRCSNYDKTDIFNDSYCGEIADSNARYCIYCGSETTFFRSGILKPWNEIKSASTDTLETDDFADMDESSLPF